MRAAALLTVLGLLGCSRAPASTSPPAAAIPTPSAAPVVAPVAPTPPRDPAHRLVAETLALPVRGGVAYWGLTPPADCSARSATDAALRFLCTVTLDELGRYFRYYYPVLRLVERPGGLTVGGAPEQATAHAVSLPAGQHAVQLILNRPQRGGRDEVAEALVSRLLARP
jgi:hypothetical protein